MKAEQRLLHSVNGTGKIKLSKKMMDEVGLVPGRRIEIVIESGIIKIRPIN
jgi:antitoxin component of MazEF toxin-antitoxin module